MFVNERKKERKKEKGTIIIVLIKTKIKHILKTKNNAILCFNESFMTSIRIINIRIYRIDCWPSIKSNLFYFHELITNFGRSSRNNNNNNKITVLILASRSLEKGQLNNYYFYNNHNYGLHFESSNFLMQHYFCMNLKDNQCQLH